MEKNLKLAKILTGLFIVLFGLFILLDQLEIDVPKWLKSWEIILIMIGFVSLIKHNFKNFSGYVLIIIGASFLLKDYYPNLIQIRLILPSLIILFGITIIYKAIGWNNKKKYQNLNNEDTLVKISTFFGSNHKIINSEEFKGATISAVFSSSNMDLTQTDFEENAFIDVSAVFSGVTIVVKNDWEIKSEITSIFGGIEDKRKFKSSNVNIQPKKTLILRGECVFSGVDIVDNLN